MDDLIGVLQVIGISCLALLAIAFALCLVGAVGYLFYIPILIGWISMRRLLEKIGVFEFSSPTENIEDTLDRIRDDLKELSAKLDER